MASASRPHLPLEVSLETGGMVGARSCAQEIDDPRLTFVLRQWRGGVINARLLQRFVTSIFPSAE